MRNVYKKIIAIALVAAIGSTFGACGKKDKDKDSKKDTSTNSSVSDESSSDDTDDSDNSDDSISAESLDAEQASAALKQNLTITLDDQDSQEDAVENNQDATEGNGSSNGGSSNNGSSNGGNQYVEVTNDKGEVQTDANGNAETKSVSNGAGSANGGSVSDPNYVSKTTVAKTYWLDMTKSDNYVFDGEFLVATFKVKDTTPDGSYPIDITKADVANWEAETLTPDIINGYVTIGDAQTPSTDTATDGNFTFSVDSVTAKAGDTIEVKFKVSSNPGLVAFVFNFSFDSNALEYQGLSVGKDAEDIITLSE